MWIWRVVEAHGYAASSLPVADLAVAAWLLGSAAPRTRSRPRRERV